jgi:hypothetical protein
VDTKTGVSPISWPGSGHQQRDDFDDPTSRYKSLLLGDAFSLRDDDQFLVKVAYRFEP